MTEEGTEEHDCENSYLEGTMLYEMTRLKIQLRKLGVEVLKVLVKPIPGVSFND